ncbi:MAG: GIY-YIG nuclease family protein [Clostridia bacterium]|nr:GIY-YIG nuclease family protein [Clostridia bacterium]
MPQDFFPNRPQSAPKIYAYSDTRFPNMLKVGYTTKSVEERVADQYPVLTPERSYKIEHTETAMKNDGTTFMDHEVHDVLKKKGFYNPSGEWFKCTVADVQAAIYAVKSGKANIENRNQTFAMRPEQREAVQKTADYFLEYMTDENGKPPHFLWNCKMRFGKTFAAYQLAKKLSFTKILVLTFKPAVQSAWEEDLRSHVDFEGWQFIARNGLTYEQIDHDKPFVCFASFQDFLGKNKAGGIKLKNEWAHTVLWDMVVFDEYHYGAWRENAKELFEAEDDKESKAEDGGQEFFNEDYMPISTRSYLYLSGTPFRAISSGEFIEEQIYNWTYSDEQREKLNWDMSLGQNPYASLPRMVLLTYQLPESITHIASGGEFDEFDLNVFFSAEGEGEFARFKYEDEVQKWLDLIRGNYLETTIDNLRLGAKKPPLPFSNGQLLNLLSHTLWFLPSVSACYAMRNLLAQKQNKFYHDYNVVVCAGAQAGIGLNALPPVKQAMEDPLSSKSITLSCGKLTTGVTVKPWTGMFMLRNLTSPETYFQAAFRVQSPWTVKSETNLNEEEIIKLECYVFDFAPERALKQIADYSCRLNVDEVNPERKVAEFIKFLPVLAYDGSSMKQIDAAGILDIAMSGTTATLLARRWESALLVNVDNFTLARLMANEQAMNALMSIEGFRSLNNDLETIINKSEKIKKAKEKANSEELTPKERKELSDDEKEYKSKRKIIQEKLIKFATRVPVFMYLTDYREQTLKEVITQLEPGLFKKVTGLDVKDFELLCSLNLFNAPLMNDAVFKFKRYEDSSLSYTGINRHSTDTVVGGFDTVILNNSESA